MKSKKIFGLLLAISLIIGLLPITALAEEFDDPLEVVTEIEFTITPPECGTIVTAEPYSVKNSSGYDPDTQSPIPVVTLPENAPYELDEYEDYLYGYWYEDEEGEILYVSSDEHPFMKGGETFYALIYLRVKDGYIFPPGDDIPIVSAPEDGTEIPSKDDMTINITGGTLVSYDLSGSEGGSFYIRIIAAVEVEHIEGPATAENVVPATCLEDGSHDDVVRCTYCEEEISRTTVGDVALGHDWDEWFVSKEAAVGVNGEEMRICKRDSSHVETRALSPKTGDHNSYGLWIALSAISASLIICLIMIIRPRRRENEK